MRIGQNLLGTQEKGMAMWPSRKRKTFLLLRISVEVSTKDSFMIRILPVTSGGRKVDKKEQLADLGTKPLSKKQFRILRKS